MTPILAAGIDVSQSVLDVGLSSGRKPFQVANNTVGISSLVRRLKRCAVERVVVEAIGCYGRRLNEALCRAGFEVGVINPKRIRAFREAEGRRAKTDRLDAALMARFAVFMSDAMHPVPSPKALALKALSARRRQLTQLIATEKTRLKQALDPLLVQSHRTVIALLEEQCAAVEAELERGIKADKDMAERQAILLSIPGFGPRISTLLVTDLPELGQRDRRAIASLAGLAPHVSQSGQRPARAAIAGGRPCVRSALYMAALVAVRHNREMGQVYEGLRAQGKPAKVALIAVARKLVIIANTLIKRRQSYVEIPAEAPKHS